MESALGDIICNNSEKEKSILNLEKYCKENNISEARYSDLLSGYLYDELCAKATRSRFDNKLPILICVVKDERVRMTRLFEHYRNIGICQFVIIDNDSKDGTLQFCMEQEDANVYSIKAPYSSAKRVAWINQILSKYGRDRWYMIVDSDELIDYIGSETFPITELIKKMDEKHIKRVLGVQVDFYPKADMFSSFEDSINWEECVYFDRNTYITQNSDKCVWYVGGPRKRLLKTFSLLTKYPLFYFDDSTINISSHYLYPFEDNFGGKCYLCIKHYEFLNNSDYKKMLEIIDKKNYASGSREYCEMFSVIENSKGISFFDEEVSEKRCHSDDLLKIEILEDWKD